MNLTKSALISRWLEPDPNRPGRAEWRVVGTGLPVWRVFGQFAVESGLDLLPDLERLAAARISHAQIKAVARFYDVPAEAVRAVLEYCRLHPAEVIARLIVDRAAFRS